MKLAALPAGRALPLPPITRIVAGFRAARKERAELRGLLDLDDATLRDIGLRRHEVMTAAGMARRDDPSFRPTDAAGPAPDPFAYLRRMARDREARFA